MRSGDRRGRTPVGFGLWPIDHRREFANSIRPFLRRAAAHLDLRLYPLLSCPDTRLGIKVSERTQPLEF
jgi:hypothetical protein